jgi:hypothetical protein
VKKQGKKICDLGRGNSTPTPSPEKRMVKIILKLVLHG